MNILAFFAHPDDETMLAGGLLALLAKSGASVHYLCATRGEGGEAGEPALCAREELGNTREAEMVCAVGALRGRSLTFLGYTDPLVGPEAELYSFSDDLARVAGQVDATIRQFEIEAVLTHGSDGEYGHPAHLTCHMAARVAVEAYAVTDPDRPQPRLYTVQANFPDHPKPRLANQSDPAHLVVDITPVLEQKIRAAECHRTQHALFVRRASEEAGRPVTVPEVIVPLESLRRLLPASAEPPDDDLMRVLKQWEWNNQPENEA